MQELDQYTPSFSVKPAQSVPSHKLRGSAAPASCRMCSLAPLQELDHGLSPLEHALVYGGSRVVDAYDPFLFAWLQAVQVSSRPFSPLARLQTVQPDCVWLLAVRPSSHLGLAEIGAGVLCLCLVGTGADVFLLQLIVALHGHSLHLPPCGNARLGNNL